MNCDDGRIMWKIMKYELNSQFVSNDQGRKLLRFENDIAIME
jgi:hypothetical protein